MPARWDLSLSSLETTVSGHGPFRQPACAVAGIRRLAAAINSGASAKQNFLFTDELSLAPIPK
jgi:hypothetical protein